jgi:transcriptional antiterminator RfaH
VKHWYVVHTKPRAEETALAHLRRQAFEAFLPRFLKKRRHARRIDMAPSPLFPGYLFVALDSERSLWRSIRGTIGVNGLICHGDQPAPVPDGIVEEIIGRQDPNGFVQLRAKQAFEKGQTVEIAAGPFAETRGLFEGMDSRERVIVLLSLLGREVRACIPADWIQAPA